MKLGRQKGTGDGGSEGARELGGGREERREEGACCRLPSRTQMQAAVETVGRGRGAACSIAPGAACRSERRYRNAVKCRRPPSVDRAADAKRDAAHFARITPVWQCPYLHPSLRPSPVRALSHTHFLPLEVTVDGDIQ